MLDYNPSAVGNDIIAAPTPQQALDLLACLAAHTAYAHGSDPRTRAICLHLVRQIHPRKPWLGSPCHSSPTSDPA